MIPATAITSILCFAGGLWLFGVVRAAGAALATARTALQALRDESLDDLARERVARQASLQLFARFGAILLRSALALLASAVPIALADVAGLAPQQAVIAFLSRWDVILAAAAVMVAAYLLWRKRWRSA